MLALLVSTSLSYAKDWVDYPKNANSHQKDFIYAVSVLEESHLGIPDHPLPFTVRDQWKSLVEETYKLLGERNNKIAFQFEMLRFITRLEDGHMRLGVRNPWDENTAYLPMEFAILKDGVYIVAVYDDRYQDLLFQSIQKLDDEPVAELVALADRYCPTDKGNIAYQHRLRSMTSHLLRTSAFYEYHDRLQSGDQVKLTVLNNGTPFEHWIAFQKETIKKDPLENLVRNSITRLRGNNHYETVESCRAMYFQLNRLSGKVDEGYIQTLFSQAVEKKLETLILDLRNNGGGNSNWCNAFFRHLINKPTELSCYKGWRRKGDRNISSGLGTMNLKPREPYFGGKLIVLTGPRTFSSATYFVVTVQDNDLGTVVGEPCGNNHVRYGYLQRETLPFSQLKFNSTQRIWERNLKREGFVNGPIMPDILVAPTIEDFRNQVDPVWKQVQSMLLSTSR